MRSLSAAEEGEGGNKTKLLMLARWWATLSSPNTCQSTNELVPKYSVRKYITPQHLAYFSRYYSLDVD